MQIKIKVWGRDGFYRAIICCTYIITNSNMLYASDENGRTIAGFNINNYYFEIDRKNNDN